MTKIPTLAACAAAILLLGATPFAGLTYRSIGPTIGRIDAVAGVPGDPLVYFAGGLGGLWRSGDGGVNWKPVFDTQPVTSIGAIAVAPSDPSLVYVGTGEPNIRNDIAFGDGMWRSQDGGKTFTHAGLDATGHIAQIAIDPRNARTAYVAAVGDPFATGTERGIYKTVDGGRSWRHVLFVDERTGASSIVISPKNPNELLAGLWTVQRRPWMLTSGGSGDGLYRSTDAGEHWSRVQGNGFPQGLTGRIGLAYAPSRPARIYALIESQRGVLWRSDDGGTRWLAINSNHVLAQRPYYFSQLSVDPKNADHIYVPSIQFSESFDGGKTIKHVNIAFDHHQVWIDPAGGKRMILGADAGTYLSSDGGKAWRNPPLIAAQAYHISTDNGTPYTVCAEFQDPGAVCAPSISFSGAITPDMWFSPESGESGWIVFAPGDRNVIYGTGYQEYVVRFDRHAAQGRNISPWPDTYSGLGAESYKYRGAWVAPLAVSPLEPSALYYGANVLLKMNDGGQTWAQISPDLTRNDKSKQRPSGQPITLDNAGTEIYDTISSIAESPTVKGELWAGTDDGLVWVTRDGGTHWTNVTAAIPNLPQWSHVNYVDPSPFADGTAYLAADAHKLGDRHPYLYVTHDFGAHWASIAFGLPTDSYARMLRADPVRRDMLYVGTETGLWTSFDGGSTWQSLRNNLPHVPIYDFVIQPQFDDLVVATHGRGVWILDDLTALQRYTPDAASRDAILFPVRDAYRWNANESTWASSEGAGDNPDGSLDVEFALKAAPGKKDPPIKIEILNATGIIKTIAVKDAVAGINRVYWDLNYDPVKPVASYKASRDGFTGPQPIPGTYTVRLSALGKTQQQTVKLLADPRSPGTQATMQAQLAFVLQLRQAYQRTGHEIDALIALRDAVKRLPAKASSIPAIASAGANVTAGAGMALDMLYQPQAKNAADLLRYPSKLYERIANLGGNLVGGDYGPTDADVALSAQLKKELDAVVATDDSLFGEKLKTLNGQLAAAGFKPIAVTR